MALPPSPLIRKTATHSRSPYPPPPEWVHLMYSCFWNYASTSLQDKDRTCTQAIALHRASFRAAHDPQSYPRPRSRGPPNSNTSGVAPLGGRTGVSARTVGFRRFLPLFRFGENVFSRRGADRACSRLAVRLGTEHVSSQGKTLDTKAIQRQSFRCGRNPPRWLRPI